MRADLFNVALSEERRAPNITAAWTAVDRWNHIINGARIAATRDDRPADWMPAVSA